MKIVNRKVRRNYEILDKFEAGISLLGGEAKAIKLGRADLAGSFVRIKEGEAFLVGLHIPLYDPGQKNTYDPIRTRKLLLHKKELLSLSAQIKQKRLTLVPLSLYTKGPRIKIKIALAKGRREYEKKEVKKKRDIDRDTQRELREKI